MSRGFLSLLAVPTSWFSHLPRLLCIFIGGFIPLPPAAFPCPSFCPIAISFPAFPARRYVALVMSNSLQPHGL